MQSESEKGRYHQMIRHRTKRDRPKKKKIMITRRLKLNRKRVKAYLREREGVALRLYGGNAFSIKFDNIK